MRVDARTGEALVMTALMRITVNNRAIKVGNIRYSRGLQGTPAATEAMFLLMKHVFDELGCRRYKWKCDSLNPPPKSAARRPGFINKREFRQSAAYKQRNRMARERLGVCTRKNYLFGLSTLPKFGSSKLPATRWRMPAKA